MKAVEYATLEADLGYEMLSVDRRCSIGHVLAIEDDWMNAEDVADVARDAGATSIEMVDTQQSAVAAAYRHLPGTILADVNLLEGIGSRAVETILEELGSIPVIFITGALKSCVPCDPPHVIMASPIRPAI